MKTKTTPSVPRSVVSDRARVLAALQDAEKFILEADPVSTEGYVPLVEQLRQEGAAVRQAGLALVLALVADKYTPASLFAPWASVKRIRQWRDDPAVRLDVIVRHGRCCLRPSDFFRHWNAMANEPVRRRKVIAYPRSA